MADENNDNNVPALDLPADAAEPLTESTAPEPDTSADESAAGSDAADVAADAAADDVAAGYAAAEDAAAAADDAEAAADAAAADDDEAADAAAEDAAVIAAEAAIEREAAETPSESAGSENLSDADAEVVSEAIVEEDAAAAADGASVEDAPADDAPADDAPADEAPAQEAPAEETPVEEAPAAPEVPAAVTAVSLGLLPEVFVSQVSTQLHFYAPEVVPLPARPGRERIFDRIADREQPQEESAPRGRGRRRRGGSDGDEQRDEPRQRQRVVEYITEPKAIKGSTRLEAKKQRRRDGRDAGRRRPVVTEAEFLARRESVDRKMVVRSKNGRTQIGVLEDGVLVEHYVARNQDASLIGNVYLGRVQNVLPSMEAAFVDIGRGRNAVLYSGEVDWDGVETGNQPRRIELALKAGDRVLVQVTKDPVGHKGARLTSQISLPGRYLVYVPGGSMNGISRKLPDNERARLKRILKEVLPESSGVIVRTAAEGATEDQLTRDVQRLTSQWEHIQKQVENQQAPALLHAEPDLLVKIVRDVFNEDFTKMLIQGEDAQQTIRAYLESVAPDLLERVEAYEDEIDPFDAFRITEQIEKALDRKVWLPSGGSLVIDRTEAMTVVDVNTGKFVGSGGNLEETVTKNNLEAAEEIVRQLRLRDIGGIIVVDFIDMVLESNRDLVLRRLIECLSRDRTKHQVAEVTSLGLVQMTRKKLGLGLLETFSEACEVCAGRGVIVHHDPVVKHRSSNNSNGGNNNGSGNGQSGRRQRGGNGGNGQSQNAPAAPNVTHSITEGAKSALAQIAASTIAPAAEGSAEAERADVASDASVATDRPKKARKKRGGERKAPKSPAEQLLDSVLDALPEPKAPGQGRGRRRVSTAALTGTPVSVNSEPSAPIATSDSES
ncbi:MULTISPECIES: Rne/Rng family ribonuclease [unclassified Microbacterium]|uniref:Rne/Rng family ribonuclease n=1 Tax=unclassified Microbacterium TaxID=2609290 RepID=UPI001604F3B3|nr:MULTISPECIES: Rne/Rng family ribonuclease [unclassified Microbacterium]QNA92850.1 Rne/Rng family ribonuclease [Microbacterium sp. Se63.02b]QYM62995.1 Rne/Rng family ribonuclease [Microbacterium sp. Se5.02b]